MKTNFKNVMIACAAMLFGFASCNLNESNPNPGVEEGKETYATLSFSFPDTRAEDTGTAAESAVEKVDVFIFQGQTLQGHHPFGASDFELKNGSYEAKRNIKTTTGAKTVYVGVNMPWDFTSTDKITTVGELTTVVKSLGTEAVKKLVKYETSKVKNIAMFSITPASKVFEESANESDPSNLPAANQVAVSVQRMVTKAAVSENASLSLTIPDYATFANLNFKVAGILNETYISQRVSNSFVKSPDWERGGTVNTSKYVSDSYTYESVNPAGRVTTADDFIAQYSTENTNESVPREGETTRIVVRAQAKPLKVWKSSSSDLSTDNAWDKWGQIDNAEPIGTTFYMLEDKFGTQYFFIGDDAASKAGYFIAAYNLENGGTTAENFAKNRNYTTGVGDAHYMTVYTDGLSYWNKLWLNIKGDSGNQGIGQAYRNDFYHVTIDRITGMGDGSEGTDPEKPIITEETDTYIHVTMKVMPWNYVANGVDL